MPLFLPYFSTIFPAKPVEKAVENVDNLFYVNITSCYRIYYVNLYLDQNHSHTTKTAVPGFPRIPLFFVHTELQLGPI